MAETVTSIDELEEKLETIVNECLQFGITSEVLGMLINNAQVDVYDKYEPFVYDRAYSLTEGTGGTYDISNGDMELSISVNHPWGKLIEYGDGVDGLHYSYPYNRNDTAELFLKPRPFFRHTKEQLEGGKFKEILKGELKEYGLNVK